MAKVDEIRNAFRARVVEKYLTECSRILGRPLTIEPRVLAVEALRLMEQRKITSLPVVSEGGQVLGVLHLHDLWHTQMF